VFDNVLVEVRRWVFGEKTAEFGADNLSQVPALSGLRVVQQPKEREALHNDHARNANDETETDSPIETSEFRARHW
jgi:hypothetical protein